MEPNRVVDRVGIISAAEQRSYNWFLEQMHGESGIDLRIVLVPTVGNSTPEQFALATMRELGIGRAARDAGSWSCTTLLRDLTSSAKAPFTGEASMQGEPPVPAVTIEQRRVHKSSLIRALVVCAVWLATWPLRPSGGEVRLGLDLMLALGGWWAMLPGRRAGGKIFGEHGHWSTLIVGLPIGFAIAAAAELWHILRGTG